MKKACNRLAAIACCALCVICAVARAGVVTGTPEQWNSGFQGWTNAAGASDAVLENSDGWLRLRFTGYSGPPPAGGDETIRTWGAPATDMFVGNYSNADAIGVRFSFRATNQAPSQFELQFESGGHLWYYALSTNVAINSWTDYEIPFDYNAGWDSDFGWSASTFLSDLESVDWIGLYIAREGSQDQAYELDDFELFVPEPAGICLLASAVAALACTYGRRRRRIEGGRGRGTPGPA